jgi:NAD(P)-dependent dehydrogenase (short-subunit alcohol dehydrogenase family)
MYERNGYFFGWLPYQQSKLANVLFTFELARRLEGTQVTSNALHPGFVATNLGKSDGSILGKFAMGIAHKFAISPQQGALTSIYLASQSDVSGISGKYFDKCQITQPDPAALDQEAASRLWSVSETLTGI